jgi:ribosomal protein S18 acetylase RimI-like enzyme
LRLSARIPETPEDVEALRVIRNECRLFMTRDQSEISPKRQAEWWKRDDKGLLFLFDCHSDTLGTDFGPSVGYGRLAPAAGAAWWLSGGLVEACRGCGLGRHLFGFLSSVVQEFGKIPCLEVLVSNTRAIAVYETLGFIQGPDDKDGVRVMGKGWK